jgi:colanic acid biosynthesis protein WcaH
MPRYKITSSIKKIIDSLEFSIRDPSEGLSEDVFLLVSRITPLINVDLLIKNEQNYILLTWRDDGYYPPSWHVPGGIIRYKETISARINAVAASELGAAVRFKKGPLAINEVIHPSRKNRGHFISLLYECTLVSSLDENLMHKNGVPKAGEWSWHNKCPKDIIPVHDMYREFLDQGALFASEYL